MLKRFVIENFSSFLDEQCFDLTAGATQVLPQHCVETGSVKLLKSAVVYGANASGKSNLIRAIDFARKAIVSGLSSLDTYKKSFRLCEENKDKSSKFEFEVELNGRFFSYGFSSILKDKEIIDEWLVEIGSGKPKFLYTREKNNIKIGKESTNPGIRNRFEIYIDDMKNQSKKLFLTEVASKNINSLDDDLIYIINELYNWFSEKLIIIFPNDKFNGIRSIDDNLISSLTNYLKSFGTGVTAIDTIDEDFDKVFKNFPDELKSRIENDLQQDDVKEIVLQGIGVNSQFYTIYKDVNQNIKVRRLGFIHGEKFKETFELHDESDGTKRLLDFIPLISKFSQDYTVIIDEFDRSLHPKLTKEFFKLFHEISTVSQFIVTTHESTLLDLDLVRRDEIWFVEKNNDSSSIFSLNKFQIRYDAKVEKAYLLGRYGAVPIFQEFDCWSN